MSKADKAEELFRSGCNCAQSVLGAFAEDIGLTQEQAMKIAGPFGAGIGSLREVCGAVTGMMMVLGLTKGYDSPKDAAGKKETYRLAREMAGEFEAREGSLICRELLHLQKGETLEEPAVRTEAYYQERPCLRAIRDAADIVERTLESAG